MPNPTIPRVIPNPANVGHPGVRDWIPAAAIQPANPRFDDLLAFLPPTPQGRSRHTTVIVRNETTPERNAVIVCAGVHFVYSDLILPNPSSPPPPVWPPAGTRPLEYQLDYMAGPTDVEVYSGGATAFRSTDPRRSVIEVRVAVKVRFGFDARPPYHTADFVAYYNPTDEVDPTAPAGKYKITDVTFELRAKPAAEKIDTPSSVFELRRGLER